MFWGVLGIIFFIRTWGVASSNGPYLHSCPAILGGRVQDVGHPRAHQGPQIHPEDLKGAVHRVLRDLTSDMGYALYTCSVRFYPNSLAAVAVCSYGSGLPSLWNSQSMFVYVTFKSICGFFPQVGILRFQNPMGFSLYSFCLYHALKL